MITISKHISFSIPNTILVAFEYETLNSYAKEMVNGRKNVLIPELLKIEHPKEKNMTYMYYKMDEEDAKAARIIGEMCLVDDELGFVISPPIPSQVDTLLKCYNAIKEGKYTSYFKNSESRKGYVNLFIEF